MCGEPVNVLKAFTKMVESIFIVAVFLFMNIVILPELIFSDSTAHVVVGLIISGMLWGCLTMQIYVWFMKRIRGV